MAPRQPLDVSGRWKGFAIIASGNLPDCAVDFRVWAIATKPSRVFTDMLDSKSDATRCRLFSYRQAFIPDQYLVSSDLILILRIAEELSRALFVDIVDIRIVEHEKVE
jgi:hypothetical protein